MIAGLGFRTSIASAPVSITGGMILGEAVYPLTGSMETPPLFQRGMGEIAGSLLMFLWLAYLVFVVGMASSTYHRERRKSAEPAHGEDAS